MTEGKPSAEPNPSLKLAGTQALKGVAQDDPRMVALRQACELAESLKQGALALAERSRLKGGKDPMTVVQGCNSLERALADVEELIRQLDETLSQEVAHQAELQATR
jgi:type VII secretion effector (TIGR04197 family)